MQCPHLFADVCAIAIDICRDSGVVAHPKPHDTACDRCAACEFPRQRNAVTCSVAIGAVKDDPASVNRIVAAVAGKYMKLCNHVHRVQLGDGVGTELHRLLLEKGYDIEDGCACLKTIREMNEQGPQWCCDNAASIIDVMVTESYRRDLGSVANRSPRALRIYLAGRWLRQAVASFCVRTGAVVEW